MTLKKSTGFLFFYVRHYIFALVDSKIIMATSDRKFWEMIKISNFKRSKLAFFRRSKLFAKIDQEIKKALGALGGNVRLSQKGTRGPRGQC
jgi:hypothetical protein